MVSGKASVRLVTVLVAALVVGKPAMAQSLVWENRGQSDPSGSALDAREAGRVVVGIGLVGADFKTQWFVRGLDRRTGATVWEDRFGPVTFGLAKDIAVEGQRAFVAGWILTPGRGFEFVVRAYDVDSGFVLWSRELNQEPDCVDERPDFARCVAKAVSVRNGRVFVVGHLTRTAAQSDFAVLAFDAATGASIWESVTDPSGTGANDYAWAVSAHGDSVFVLGEIGNLSGLLLQAHDARTGIIRWRHYLPGARNFTLKTTLAADRHAVFVAGMDDEAHFFVQGYASNTGALLWDDRVKEAGQVGGAAALSLVGDDDGDHDQDRRGERNDSDRRLFATGVVGCDPETFVGCRLAVRAYDPQRGLVWHRSDEAQGEDWNAGQIASGGGRLFVGAQELLEDGAYHATVRSYSAKDGRFEGDVPLDEGVGQPFSFVNSVSVQDGRLVVAVDAIRPDGGEDFLVRTYRVGKRAQEEGDRRESRDQQW